MIKHADLAAWILIASWVDHQYFNWDVLTSIFKSLSNLTALINIEATSRFISGGSLNKSMHLSDLQQKYFHATMFPIKTTMPYPRNSNVMTSNVVWRISKFKLNSSPATMSKRSILALSLLPGWFLTSRRSLRGGTMSNFLKTWGVSVDCRLL